jgi:hypothetical protein
MRHPAFEKLEIIRTVENSHLPTRQTRGDSVMIANTLPLKKLKLLRRLIFLCEASDHTTVLVRNMPAVTRLSQIDQVAGSPETGLSFHRRSTFFS